MPNSGFLVCQNAACEKFCVVKNIINIAKNSLFAIIMGNEGNGMSDTVSELCDSFVYINMNDKCESLNVGVAASILMYELGSK